MIESDEFNPAFESFTYDTEDGKLDVTIKAGVGDRDCAAAGWYIFCNGRLILEADTTAVTGWGTSPDESMPVFHNQYYRFRGVVHFSSDDTGMLPWNTTKSGVNEDSAVYKRAKQKMVSKARPVINFLNQVENQKRNMELEKEESTPLEQRMDEAEKVDTKDIADETDGSNSADESEDSDDVDDESTDFESPDPQEENQSEDDPDSDVGITYHRKRERVEEVMRELGVDSAKSVGEETFEYYWELEDLEV